MFLSVTPIIFFLIRLVSFKIAINFGIINASRIGNLAAVCELYLCEQQEKRNKNFFFFDIIAIEKPVCNYFLLEVIKRKINFFPYYFVKSNIIFISFINRLFNLGNKNLIYKSGHLTEFKDRDTKNFFLKYSNQLKLNNSDLKKGKKLLSELNITEDDKIVCLIVRDNAYLEAKYSKNNFDWSYHAYRDCNIENYKLACEYLVSKGYKVFRMGKIVNKKILFANKDIIDYPFSKIKSDFMDIYLASKCDFCISTGLGYDAVPAVFRKPIVYTNVTPLGCVWTFHKKYLAIFKHLIFKKKKNLLTTSQHFSLDLDRAGYADTFKKKSIEIIENNDQDILDAVRDMIFLINNNFDDSSVSKVNNQDFWKNFKKNVFKKYKSFDFYGDFKSNVPNKFVKKYPNYLV